MATPSLLPAGTAEQARTALGAIERSHRRARLGRDGSVASGLAGAALFEMALEGLGGAAGHARRAQWRLEAALASTQAANPPSLFSGAAGIGWAVEILAGDPDAPPEDDPNRGLDLAFLRHLEGVTERVHFDLISGLAGLAVYAIRRSDRATGRELVQLITERLADLAQRDANGVFWKSDAAWIRPEYRGERRGEYVDLCLAHGVAGVIGVLGKAAQRDLLAPRAREMLADAVRWLLTRELPPNDLNAFPSWVGEGMTETPARTAWCYGDPGIASALWFASQGLRDDRIEREALRIARGAARRAPEHTGITDPALCHGSAGLAHIFGGFFRVTGDPVFRQASTEWFQLTLASRRRGTGVAGFASGAPGGAQTQDTSLLTGTAGIGLALASALTDDVPPWDDIFLVPK